MQLEPRHDVTALEKLSEQEDSLFLLSYVPFHVTSFTSGDEILVGHVPCTMHHAPNTKHHALGSLSQQLG